VAITYGLAGEHFEWGGEPYESAVLPIRAGGHESDRLWSGFGLFNTGIMDGVAGKREYIFGPNPVYDFTSGAAARRMVIRPCREDAEGAFAYEKAQLDEEYGEEIDKTVQRFFREAVTNDPSYVEAVWDAYMEELFDNGLSRYVDLYGRFPAGDAG
jgi:hypothetical protein